MLRLAFAFILLLLMLFGGTIWLLDMGPPSLAPEPPGEKQRAAKPDSPKSDADQLQEALNPPAAASGLGFDIARIDPDGTSVFAGRGEPRSLVTITVDGQEIGTAQVDENGEWTLTTDTKIANPDGKLALFKAPAGAVARIVGAEPRQPAMKAATTTTPAKPNTAGAVASNMLKSLEDMVATARSDAASEAPAAAAVPPAAPEVPDPSATAMPAPTRHSLAQSTTVPVPVTFVFNEATLTGDGRRAASLLLEYLQLKHFPKVTLTGHADERGSDDLNLDLSRERLETVAHFLREGGFKGQLELIPKGKSEPYSGVERGDFSQEDLWQLDRRVELVVAR